MQQRISCPNPQCPQPNDVQKVSVVVQSGIASGAYTTSQTALSSMLAAPSAPVFDQGITDIGCTVGIVFVISIIVFTIIGVAMGVGGQSAGSWVLFLVACIIPAAVGFGLSSKNKETLGARQSRYDLQRGRWNQAMQRWNESYYCHRCGSVFVAGEPQFVSASNMNQLLYQ